MATVHIDRTKCVGHGECVVIAPQLFALDDDDIAVLLREPVAADQRSLDEAIARCPEMAIIVIETA